MTRRTLTDAERIASIREALTAAQGDWAALMGLWSIHADLTWLLERVEATPSPSEPSPAEAWTDVPGHGSTQFLVGRVEPSPAEGLREPLWRAIEEVDNSWHDEGDHIEWDDERLPEALIALRKAYWADTDRAALGAVPPQETPAGLREATMRVWADVTRDVIEWRRDRPDAQWVPRTEHTDAMLAALRGSGADRA